MNFEGKCAIKLVYRWFTKTGAFTQRVNKGGIKSWLINYGCNLNLLTIKQGYKIIHKKISGLFHYVILCLTTTQYLLLNTAGLKANIAYGTFKMLLIKDLKLPKKN